MISPLLCFELLTFFCHNYKFSQILRLNHFPLFGCAFAIGGLRVITSIRKPEDLYIGEKCGVKRQSTKLSGLDFSHFITRIS